MLVFLPGYMSDMEGGKATALDAWAAAEGRALLRFDYAGCGASAGDFEAQTLGGWRDDVLTMIDRVAEGPLVLVGSSMGGWLMLLAALARPDRVAGLVGIAAAPDFTGWGYGETQKAEILREAGWSNPAARARRPSSPAAPSGRAANPCTSSTARSPSIVHCGCSTASAMWRCRGNIRWQSRSGSVQPTCRPSSSRTATTGCLASPISLC